MTRHTLADVKSQAKALRAALQAGGTPVSHAQALELVACQHGAKDWNTLHARLSLGNARPQLSYGDRVWGQFLGQPFTGAILGISGPSTHREIEIRFDSPVDVVRFESFSNLRTRVRAVINEMGQSHRRTSDGAPQLIVELENG